MADAAADALASVRRPPQADGVATIAARHPGAAGVEMTVAARRCAVDAMTAAQRPLAETAATPVPR